MMTNQLWQAILATLVIASAAYADQWPRIEQPDDGVTVVYDDFGGPSMNPTSQVSPRATATAR